MLTLLNFCPQDTWNQHLQEYFEIAFDFITQAKAYVGASCLVVSLRVSDLLIGLRRKDTRHKPKLTVLSPVSLFLFSIFYYTL